MMRPGCGGLRLWVGLLGFGILIAANSVTADSNSTGERQPNLARRQKQPDLIVAQTDSTLETPIQRSAFSFADASSGSQTATIEMDDRAVTDRNVKGTQPCKAQLPAWLAALDGNSQTTGVQGDTVHTPRARTAERVSEIIHSQSEKITALYHKRLKLDPDISGKVCLRIFVDPTGSVHNVEVVSTTLDETDFLEQICETIGQWKDFGTIDRPVIQVYRQEFVFGE
ncbi:AgmX/PglI C-terminal domain-containing protein [candidate division KSB1 bacterium]|nr:AgmX/PglI C-terminal domain-containing protein [candidate division KSB1 bacterium]